MDEDEEQEEAQEEIKEGELDCGIADFPVQIGEINGTGTT